MLNVESRIAGLAGGLSICFRRLQRFLRDEDGPTAVEYAVMIAMIIVVAIGSIRLLGTSTSDAFQSVNQAFNGSAIQADSGQTDGNQDGNGQW